MPSQARTVTQWSTLIRRTADCGTVSHGTMRTADLLESFAFELEHHVQRNAEAWCSDAGRSARDELVALVEEAREIDPETDEAMELIDELFDALERFAPDGCYFGAHAGDGSDYGFWPID